MSHTIKVRVEDKNITVIPTRLHLRKEPQNQEVVWEPEAGVTITRIDFGNDPPIDPRKEDGSERWKGTFDHNAPERSYKYAITVRGLRELDPEIEYGPGRDEPIDDY